MSDSLTDGSKDPQTWTSADGIITITPPKKLAGYYVHAAGTPLFSVDNLTALDTIGKAIVAAAAHYRGLGIKEVS